MNERARAREREKLTRKNWEIFGKENQNEKKTLHVYATNQTHNHKS